MLVVSDKRNGTAWYQQGQVTIIKPFNPCWFVLQEKENKGVLGAIAVSYTHLDVYKRQNTCLF